MGINWPVNQKLQLLTRCAMGDGSGNILLLPQYFETKLRAELSPIVSSSRLGAEAPVPPTPAPDTSADLHVRKLARNPAVIAPRYPLWSSPGEDC